MEITCKKGERVILTDNCSQMFLGHVKSVNLDLGRIVLTDIVQLPERRVITGYRNFDRNEIKEIKKCEADDPNDDEADLSSKSEILNKPAAKLSESEFDNIKRLQKEYQYIKDFKTNFHFAVSVLKTCKKIGIYAKDASKGRTGRISVLAVSTPSHIFVFDLLALGDDVVDKGLKEVLESENVVKVVHDGRLLSDCLKHKHLISLESTRDVEAEDIVVVFQDRKQIRRRSRTLEYLIKVYLEVEIEGCHGADDAWNERPLPPSLLESLVSLVSFLVPLQEMIERMYLQKLIDASSIYNTRVRSLDFFDFLLEDPKKTLRRQLHKLVHKQNQIRSEFKYQKV